MVELVIATVAAGLILFVLSNVLKFVWKWSIAHSTVMLRNGRSRFRGWKRDRHKRRVERRLDKVEAIVSAEADYKAVHPWRWPDELRQCWVDALRQLLTNEVNWAIRYPEDGATVEVKRGNMCVSWGDFRVDAGLEVPLGSIGYSGQPMNEHWDPELEIGAAHACDETALKT